MREQPLELGMLVERQVRPTEPESWKRALWPAVGLLVLGAGALVMGHVQRPERPARDLEAIVVPGNSVRTERSGDIVLLTVSITNAGPNAVTVSNPIAVPGAGVSILDAQLENSPDALEFGAVWPSASPLVVAPMAGAAVAIRFRLDCANARADLPPIPAVQVTVTAGDKKTVANVTPDDTWSLGDCQRDDVGHMTS